MNESESSALITPDVGQVLDSRYDTMNLLIEHAYDISETPSISLESMRSLDRSHLVKGLIEKAKTKWNPTLEELQGITCIMIRGKAEAWANYVHKDDRKAQAVDENVVTSGRFGWKILSLGFELNDHRQSFKLESAVKALSPKTLIQRLWILSVP